MTTTEQELHKERRKGCLAIALQRARMARRQGRNRVIVMMVFLWAFLSGPFRLPPVFQPDRGLFSPPMPSGHAECADWPITDYERGAGGYLMRRRSARSSGTGRYRFRPTLAKLMRDLRRPGARKEAAAALEARIADPVAREWVAGRIAKDEINRLSIYVRPGRLEETILAAWRDEADAALAEAASSTGTATPDTASLLEVARLLEAIAGTETVTTRGSKQPDGV